MKTEKMCLSRINCGTTICIAIKKRNGELYLAKSENFASRYKAEHHEVLMKLPPTFLRHGNTILKPLFCFLVGLSPCQNGTPRDQTVTQLDSGSF